MGNILEYSELIVAALAMLAAFVYLLAALINRRKTITHEHIRIVSPKHKPPDGEEEEEQTCRSEEDIINAYQLRQDDLKGGCAFLVLLIGGVLFASDEGYPIIAWLCFALAVVCIVVLIVVAKRK